MFKMFIVLRNRIAWCGKFPVQIITIIILSRGHTTSHISNLGLGRFCYMTARPSKPCTVHSSGIEGSHIKYSGFWVVVQAHEHHWSWHSRGKGDAAHDGTGSRMEELFVLCSKFRPIHHWISRMSRCFSISLIFCPENTEAEHWDF